MRDAIKRPLHETKQKLRQRPRIPEEEPLDCTFPQLQLQLFCIGICSIFGLLAGILRTSRPVGRVRIVPPSKPGVREFKPLKKRPAEEYLKLCGGRKCKIAVVACASSRGVEHSNFGEMALINLMIPSLLRTVESDLFAYAVYIGIDEDDAFWNIPENKKLLREHVKREMSGKSMGGRVASFPQPSNGKTRIPMNEIINVAYRDGADYIVRVNDDSEFITSGWTSTGVEALLAMDPPNIGVVGPFCRANERILTHDMVHRNHMDIFGGKYYPPVFKNWFLDDWITTVYGEERTRMFPPQHWEVRHHIGYHGTRYTVTGERWMVDDEVVKGRRIIDEWLKNHEVKKV